MKNSTKQLSKLLYGSRGNRETRSGLSPEFLYGKEESMKIKVIQSYIDQAEFFKTGTAVIKEIGEILEVSEQKGKSLIRQGYAEEIKKKGKPGEE